MPLHSNVQTIVFELNKSPLDFAIFVPWRRFCCWGAKWDCDRQKVPAFWSLVSESSTMGIHFLEFQHAFILSAVSTQLKSLPSFVSGGKNAPIYLFMAILSSIHTAVYRMNCMMSGSVTLKKTQNVGSTSPDKVEALVAFDFKRESAWKKHL